MRSRALHAHLQAKRLGIVVFSQMLFNLNRLDRVGGILLSEMAEQLDVDALIARFRTRAEAVRNRSLPPVAGEERRRFLKQAEEDFLDYSLVGAAKWSVEDNHLVLRTPLGGGG